jgi:hypothetical protein
MRIPSLDSTGAVIFIFCCGSFSPNMYPARTPKALLPARLKSASTSTSATMYG